MSNLRKNDFLDERPEPEFQALLPEVTDPATMSTEDLLMKVRLDRPFDWIERIAYTCACKKAQKDSGDITKRIPELLQYLDHKEWAMRWAALVCLEIVAWDQPHNCEPHLPKIAAQFDSQTALPDDMFYHTRDEALMVWFRLGPAICLKNIDLVLEVLSHESKDVRRCAIRILEKIEKGLGANALTPHLPKVMRMVASKDAGVQHDAIAAMSIFDEEALLAANNPSTYQQTLKAH